MFMDHVAWYECISGVGYVWEFQVELPTTEKLQADPVVPEALPAVVSRVLAMS